MSEHKRHVYRARVVDGSLVVVARAPGVDRRGGDRVDRDAALRLARSVQPEGHGFDVEGVRVSPCACGGDALSRYVEEHPSSIVAARVVVFEGDGE